MNKCLSYNILCPYANHGKESECDAILKEDCERWRRNYKSGISDVYSPKLLLKVEDELERRPERQRLEISVE